MDLKIPLNRLKFGHEDGDGINARVTGRDQDIATLAANLHAQGQIENLIVKRCGDDPGTPLPKDWKGGCDLYSVANGNRRLAAFHMIYGPESTVLINCTLHDVDESRAFEFSLTTAITAAQLHPVDQYEAFARLDERGKTHEEIAQQYGLSEKQVRQALALGRLSPKIRQAWRDGSIRADVAQAFTLALDHRTQDRVFEKLEHEHRLGSVWVRQELGADALDDDVVQLLDFISAEAYRAAGGEVTEDLFGKSHIISNEDLLKQLARAKLDEICNQLAADGWAWVALQSDLPHGARYWPQSELKQPAFEGDEEERLAKAKAELERLENGDRDDLSYQQEEELQDQLGRQISEIEQAARSRSFDAKKRKKLGCIVDVEDGRLFILYGVKKPEEARLPAAGGAAADVDAGDDEPALAKTAAAGSAGSVEEPDISQALTERLSVQLTRAAATALVQDPQLALSVLLAGLGCYSDCGVKVSINGLGERDVLGADEMDRALPLAQRLKPVERIDLLAQVAANALDLRGSSLDCNDKHDSKMVICNAIDPKMMNAALRGAFDAKDYFAGVSKALNLKAIEEALGADLARQQAKNSKIDILAFAVENVPKTGWLPPQLRVKGYDGPPVKKAALAKAETAPARSRAKKSAKKPAKKAAAKKSAPKKRKAA